MQTWFPCLLLQCKNNCQIKHVTQILFLTMIKLNYILQNVHIQDIYNVLFIIHKSYFNQQYYLNLNFQHWMIKLNHITKTYSKHIQCTVFFIHKPYPVLEFKPEHLPLDLVLRCVGHWSLFTVRWLHVWCAWHPSCSGNSR